MPIDFAQKDVLTFDCYGTLIDWEAGILAAVQPILRAHSVDVADERLLELYAELEQTAESGPYRTRTQNLSSVMLRLADRFGFEPAPQETTVLAGSVGGWPAFPDSPQALADLKSQYKLAVISNVDDELFAASNKRLGVHFDWVITAERARSYRPSLNNFPFRARSHWASQGSSAPRGPEPVS